MPRSKRSDVDGSSGGLSGHDIASLGPSDTSDSGSDMAGADAFESDESSLPVDVALRADGWHAGSSSAHLSGDSDSSGTGETAAGGGAGGFSEAADIRPDHIVTLGEMGAEAEGLDYAEKLLSEMALDADGTSDDGDDGDADELGPIDSIDTRDPTLIAKPRSGAR